MASPFPFRLIGFDLDGTLLDTSGDLGAALNHALRLIGRPEIAPERVPRLIGGGTGQMLAQALAVTGGALPPPETAALQEALVRYYHDHIAEHSRLYPGGAAMLDALAARGVVLAIATNKREALARRLLAALGLLPRFAVVLGGDTLGRDRAKPAPDLLIEMVRRGGGGPAAFVGDTSYDVRAARAAGLPVVAVSFGFHDADPHALGADAVIDHCEALIPALIALGAEAR